MPRFPVDGPRLPIRPPVEGHGPSESSDSPNANVNIRGDASNRGSSVDSPVGRALPTLGTGEAPAERPRITLRPASGDANRPPLIRPRPSAARGSGVGVALRPRATPPSSTPVSERRSDRDGDHMRFDNGRVRYDSDTTTDARGDVRGRAGLGANVAGADVYTDINFNESTGAADGRVTVEHGVGDGASVRGSVGADGDGVNHGSLGARADLGSGVHGDVEVGRNRDGGNYGTADLTHRSGANRESVRVGYREGEGVEARYDGHHEGAGWNTNENLSVNEAGEVEGRLAAEVDREIATGTRVTGRGSVTTDGTVEGGARLDHRLSDTVSVNERARVDEDGRRTHGHGVTARTSDGRTTGGVDVTHSSDGDMGADANLRHRTEGGTVHGGRVGVRASEDDPTRVNARYDYRSDTSEADARLRASAGGAVETDGSWEVDGRADVRVADGVVVNERVTLDSDGNRSHTHGVDADLSGNRGRLRGEVTHDNDGNVSADARYTRTGRDGTSMEVTAGLDGDEARVDASHTARTRTGSSTVEAGWSSEEGLRGSAELRRSVGEDTNVHGRVSGNATTGNLSGEVGANTRIGEDNALNVGGRIHGDLGDGRIGVEGRVGRGASADAVGFNARVGAETDDERTTFNVGGDLSFKGLFGTDFASRPGVDASLTLSRRKAAAARGGWAGDLRSEALEDAPEGSMFVTYGASGRASADLGVSVPMGVGYIDTGYKNGQKYAVSFTRMTDQPRLGANPAFDELEVPGSAEDVMSLNPGESFKVVGETTHASRGGGGLSARLAAGDVGNVSMGAGGEITYAVTGKTSVEVTRGGDGSARLVMSSEDKTTTGGGLKVKAGLTPDYGSLASAAHIDELPNLGPAGEMATNVARGVVNSWLSVGGRPGSDSTSGDSRIVDARVDLGHDDVRVAYESAMRGDWSELEDLSRRGHPGVDIERSVFTELEATATPLTLYGLGMEYKSAATETLKKSKVIVGGHEYKVSSDLDRDTRFSNGWFSNTEFSVSDYSRDVEAVGDADLGDVKDRERWLTWEYKHVEEYASKDDVIGSLRLATHLATGAEAEQLREYQEKIGTVESHRRMWIGPRNELRRASVATKVTIDDTGLSFIEVPPAEELWDLYAEEWETMNPLYPLPDWADPSRRAEFEDGYFVMGHDDGEFLEYSKARQVIDGLVGISEMEDSEERNDAVRELMVNHSDNQMLISMVVSFVGWEHIRLSVSVDSDAGDGGSEYDFRVTDVGAVFDIQERVFDADL